VVPRDQRHLFETVDVHTEVSVSRGFEDWWCEAKETSVYWRSSKNSCIFRSLILDGGTGLASKRRMDSCDSAIFNRRGCQKDADEVWKELQWNIYNAWYDLRLDDARRR